LGKRRKPFCAGKAKSWRSAPFFEKSGGVEKSLDLAMRKINQSNGIGVDKLVFAWSDADPSGAVDAAGKPTA
jgi:hypothetical protein